MIRLTNEQYCKDFSLMVDEFFQICFSRNPTAMAARIVDPIFEQLGYEPVTIASAEIQKQLPSVGGRGIRLDLLAHTKDGTPINIEIQQVADSTIHRRANFHHSMLQATYAEKNVAFADIPNTVVIFILGKDIFKRGLPAYVTRTCFEDNGEPVVDGRKTIFVCADYVGENLIGYLMNDIRATKWENVIDPMLREQLKYFKTTEEGKERLMGLAEEIRAAGREEGIEVGRVEGREEGLGEGRETALIEVAKNLLLTGLPIDNISRIAMLPIEKVLLLQAEMTNS